MTTIDFSFTSRTKWVEVYPAGVVVSANNMRPVMVFKDKTEKRVLPVWLSHMDAGIAVSQGNTPYQSAYSEAGSPHELSWKVLTQLGIQLDKCFFKKVVGLQQFVELEFSHKDKAEIPAGLKKLSARADDAISFCMRSGCRFYATLDYIEKSRILEDEMFVKSKSKTNLRPVPNEYLN